MSAANGALQKAPCPALAGPLGGPGACGAGVGGGTLVCVVSGGEHSRDALGLEILSRETSEVRMQ